MTNPLNKYIIEHRIKTEVQLDKRLISEYEHIPYIQEKFQRDLMSRFNDEMLASRIQDIKKQEMNYTVKHELELYVFNREELTKLIEEVEKHVILNKFNRAKQMINYFKKLLYSFTKDGIKKQRQQMIQSKCKHRKWIQDTQIRTIECKGCGLRAWIDEYKQLYN